MERHEIISILHALANGVDPATGHAVDYMFTGPQVIRALFGAADLLTHYPVTDAESPPERHKTLVSAGTRWSHEEDTALSCEYQAGTTIAEIAKTHGRTPTAITMRLTKLGLIIDNANVALEARRREAAPSSS